MNLDRQNISHLFTIRLWFEPTDSRRIALRMRVHHILSGDVRYFREWSQVIEFIGKYSAQPKHQPVAVQQTEQSADQCTDQRTDQFADQLAEQSADQRTETEEKQA